jgi:hypothetical protein
MTSGWSTQIPADQPRLGWKALGCPQPPDDIGRIAGCNVNVKLTVSLSEWDSG